LAYTSFFRDADALKAIADIAIPELSHLREIRVWDAGCATGEEPYTLAILFASKLGPFIFRNLDILATDHEESSFPQFAERIRRARYSRTDIFWVPEELRNAYFLPTEDPESFQLTDEIRERVRFTKHDLLSFHAPETGQSLIVCKNVLMHFDAEGQEGVLSMFHASLQPGGFLALDGDQAMPASFARQFRPVEAGSPLYRKSAT
jgi:chemotaxis protein methyltransferase CheR